MQKINYNNNGLNEIRTHDTGFKVPCANRYTIRPALSNTTCIFNYIAV